MTLERHRAQHVSPVNDAPVDVKIVYIERNLHVFYSHVVLAACRINGSQRTKCQHTALALNYLHTAQLKRLV